MPGLLSDVRFGLRALVANPSFVVLAVVCLGIGIGASTMTFTAINAVLIQPLGAIDAKGIVGIGEAHRSAPNAWLDVPRFAAVAAFLALIALAASVGPALRAARVDPNVMLRS